jgi:hypothetical protein
MNPLLWVLQFTFGCHHRHMSRVFTIKHRTYRVCFDCGGEFDLPGITHQRSPNRADQPRFLSIPSK